MRYLACGAAPALGFQAIPEKGMVPGLSRIIENSGLGSVPGNFFDYGLGVLFFQIGPGQELVSVIDICLVVLVVVKFQGPCAEIGLKRIFRIRQVGQCESHTFFSLWLLWLTALLKCEI